MRCRCGAVGRPRSPSSCAPAASARCTSPICRRRTCARRGRTRRRGTIRRRASGRRRGRRRQAFVSCASRPSRHLTVGGWARRAWRRRRGAWMAIPGRVSCGATSRMCSASSCRRPLFLCRLRTDQSERRVSRGDRGCPCASRRGGRASASRGCNRRGVGRRCARSTSTRMYRSYQRRYGARRVGAMPTGGRRCVGCHDTRLCCCPVRRT